MNTKTKRNIKNLTFHLIKKGKIETSVPYAKQVRKRVEKLITRAKKDTVFNRRCVARKLPREGVNLLFKKISPANIERMGGYTRIIRIGYRKGDGSERCLLEIINV